MQLLALLGICGDLWKRLGPIHILNFTFFISFILHILSVSGEQVIEVMGGIFALWKRILASRSFCPKYVYRGFCIYLIIYQRDDHYCYYPHISNG